MKGHVRPRGKDGKTWAIVVDVGVGPDGGRKQQWTTFHGGRKEADNKLLSDMGTGACVSPSNLTVGEYLGRWLKDYARTNVAAQTYQRYEVIIRQHLAPALGAIKLGKLTALDIQRCHSEAL